MYGKEGSFDADSSKGPSSSHRPSLPTTCFVDVILIPLSSWIYLVLVAGLLLARWQTLKPAAAANITKGTGDLHSSTPTRRRRILHITGLVTYYFGLLAMTAMVSIEVGRLTVAGAGVGLLPFLYVAFVVAAVLKTPWISAEDPLARMAGVIFWVVFIVMSAVKLATVGEGGEARSNAYPRDDQLTDVGVELGLAVVLALLDAGKAFKTLRSKR